MFPLVIALVLRMHDNIFVVEFSFGASSRYLKWSVFEVIEFSRLFDGLCFNVRKRGLMFRTPIDRTLAAVHITIVIHLYECLLYFGNNLWIKGKLFARPIARCSQCTDLALHVRFVENGKVIDLFIEFLRVHAKT